MQGHQAALNMCVFPIFRMLLKLVPAADFNENLCVVRTNPHLVLYKFLEYLVRAKPRYGEPET